MANTANALCFRAHQQAPGHIAQARAHALGRARAGAPVRLQRSLHAGRREALRHERAVAVARVHQAQPRRVPGDLYM